MSTPRSDGPSAHFAADLDRLTAGSLVDLRAERRERYLKACGPLARRVVIVGAGPLSRLLVERLRATPVEILAVADNDPAKQGTQFEGFDIVTVDEAAARHNGGAAFVVAVYNGDAVRRQLRALGCATVIPYVTLFWAYPEQLMPHCSLADPEPIWSSGDDIIAAYELMADDESRDTFSGVIHALAAAEYTFQPRVNLPSDTYFAPDLIHLDDHGTFVDCGAFDGDAIQVFLDRCKGKFDSIVAIEPDSISVDKCRRYIASLPKEIAGRIELVNSAVGDASGTLRFSPTGDVTSSAASDGSVTVALNTLDDILVGYSPTLIKMDIEGAEPEALQGAIKSVGANRPSLAVCTYHRLEHLWQIPLQIARQWPGYRIFLRRYSEDTWETVCYAV